MQRKILSFQKRFKKAKKKKQLGLLRLPIKVLAKVLTYFAVNLLSAHKMWGEKIITKHGENLMEHINRIELQGRVGTVRTNTVNGSLVANFSIATDNLYKNRDGSGVSETTWHHVVAWSGKDMPDLSRITVGMPLHVIGRMRSTRYTAADGTEKYFYEVMAQKVMPVTDEDGKRQ